ncbi:hypothetical protein [Leifsonia sp. NPDC058230]|uniref:hypothetical protein n=1 Tax=Leifsonia sp. NPDC058230 TaxID=3346391 RepID=UPI0036DA8A6D
MDDLTGTSGERARQLSRLEAEGPLQADWLRRQLVLVLEAWAEDQKVLDIEAEGHEDF